MEKLIARTGIRYVILLLLITVTQLFLLAPIQGQTDDFGSALKAGIVSFPPYPDIAGIGGAWAAVARLSSDNPASLSVFNEYRINAIVYSNPTQIHFNRGRVLYAVSNGMLLLLADGCLKVAHTLLNADRFYNKKLPGSTYELDSQDVKIYYGRKINDKLALGLRFKPWSSAKLKLKVHQTLAESKEHQRFNIKPGVLYQPMKNWYLGITYDYADDKTKITSRIQEENVTFNSYTRIWRMGVSWQPRKGTLLAFDWQVGEIDGLEKGYYDIDMFFFGVEQYIHQNVALRMGSLDGSVTAGAGFSYKNFFLDYSYIKESLIDLNPHFGSSSAHTIAVSLVF